jgi:hypothetical protein
MDHANQPAGQPPPDSSSTQPFKITPGWPAEYELAPGYGPPPGSAAPPVYGPSPPGPQPLDDPEPRPRRGRHRTLLRWAGGIAAAVLVAAGGTLAGLKLTRGSAPSNTPVAVALNQALGSSSGPGHAIQCPRAAAGSSAGSQADAGHCRPGNALRLVKGMYGQVTYHGRAGTATLAFERGRVGLASGGHLTVRAPNGTTWTWNLAGDAAVREHGTTAPSGALHSGALVFVAGQVSGGSKDARLVLIRPANGSSPGFLPAAPASSPSAPGDRP